MTYFSLSMFCFISAVSASQTYFSFFVRKSVQLASQVASLFATTFPQFPSGTGAFLLMFSVTSSAVTLGFHLPRSGCAPLPMNMPGGSAI